MTINLTNKIILAHRGFFNRECRKYCRENSKETCALSSAQESVNIIELDIRKSKDGILYCYHGTLLEYWLDLKFPKNFSSIKKKYNVNSLAEVLDVITEDKIIFLDIKDSRISREDILNAFSHKKFRKVILGNRSTAFLGKFSDMPKEFVKILNGNILCNFYDLKKLRQENFKYFEVVFPFQINKKILEEVSKNGIEFRVAGLFFLSRKSYWRTIEKWGIRHVSSDFI